MIVKVVPYIKTLGTERFKELISAPFDYNMLDNIDDSNVLIIFKDWSGKHIGKHVTFTNNNVTLEFHDTYYTIRKVGSVVKLYLPETIDDFINAMYLQEIGLYWEDWIDEKFEPKDYLPKNRIKHYYADLLHKMDKDAELKTLKDD